MNTRSRCKNITIPVSVERIRAGHKKLAKVNKFRSENSVRSFRKKSVLPTSSTKMPSTPSALSLPTAPFSTKDPEGWFRQLEAIFKLANVKDDDTQYTHLQARMDPTILRGVSEFFSNVPADNKYKALKEKIIGKYSETRDAQVIQLLEGLSLGDRRPSELLGDLQRLAGSDISDTVLKTMFIKKLPEKLGGILAGSSETLVKLGELADRIYAFYASTSSQIAACSTMVPSSPFDVEMRQIKAMLTSIVETNVKLATRLTVLETELQNRPSTHPSRRHDRSITPPARRRSTSRDQFMPPDSKLCFYHYKFMGKAQKCKPLLDGTPCKWNNLNS